MALSGPHLALNDPSCSFQTACQTCCFREKSFPRALGAEALLDSVDLSGTTEVVPFQNSDPEGLLLRAVIEKLHYPTLGSIFVQRRVVSGGVRPDRVCRCGRADQ